ncbi:MAG: 50S ribosomal protein L34e [Candidatus Diapherotrites archaeon]|nr:50S ribosomal protein L34e [Candidatus Diapherotrites archaeon]
MPSRTQKTKKRKFRRLPHGKSKLCFQKAKSSRHHCALCEAVMHGVPHGKRQCAVGKMGKSERRPNALFAGTLCNKCRKNAVLEAAKVESGCKQMQSVELRLRKFASQVRVE